MMKHVWNITTVEGRVIPVLLHATAGFVWLRPDGKRANYAIPEDMPGARDRLLFQVRQMYRGATLTEVMA